jgi:hypothetical protein
VFLSLFILASVAAVIYLVRTRHPDDNFEDVVFFPSASARRQRNLSSSTASTKASSTLLGKSKHARTGTDESTMTVKEKLAGMFRSLGSTTRTAGWHRASEDDDDWDNADPRHLHPNMTELGLRRAPSAAVIVQPTTRGQHVSESATAYDGQHAATLPLRQPVRRSSDDLSETSTIVVRERPVPPPMDTSTLGRYTQPASPSSYHPQTHRPGPQPSGRALQRHGTGSSAASNATSPPGSFYSARMDFTPEEEGLPMPRREVHSRQASIESYTGSRFREDL